MRDVFLRFGIGAVEWFGQKILRLFELLGLMVEFIERLSLGGCVSGCKIPLCIPIFCLPKAGCIYICFPPPLLVACPLCCIWCALIFGDPVELPREQAEILSSYECQMCTDNLRTIGGEYLNSYDCKICLEKVVSSGVSLSSDCDMCFMDIRDYGEVGADSPYCMRCVEQWEDFWQSYQNYQSSLTQ